MSFFNHLIGFKDLPYAYQKNQKREILESILKSHKAMGIYDSQMSETVLMSYFNEEIEKKFYTSNGYGKFFIVDVKQISLQNE